MLLLGSALVAEEAEALVWQSFKLEIPAIDTACEHFGSTVTIRMSLATGADMIYWQP